MKKFTAFIYLLGGFAFMEHPIKRALEKRDYHPIVQILVWVLGLLCWPVLYILARIAVGTNSDVFVLKTLDDAIEKTQDRLKEWETNGD